MTKWLTWYTAFYENTPNFVLIGTSDYVQNFTNMMQKVNITLLLTSDILRFRIFTLTN